MFGAGVITVLLILAAGLFALRQGSADNLGTTVDDSLRPAKGVPADLVLTDNEIAAARASLNGSFIGMVACVLTTDYHASLAAAVRSRAQALNLPVKVEDANNDKTQQPVIINRMVAQGAKGIVLCELDAQSVNPAIDDAVKAGVKVVRLSDVVSPRGTVSLTFTNEAMGQAVGDFTGDLVNKQMNGQATVAILDYPQVPVLIQRADAMQKALLAKAPNVKIVGRFLGGLADNGQKSMTDALQKFPDINVIMSINDAGAIGAVKALEQAGKKGDEVKIVSVDAENEAKRMIRDGEFFVASVDSGAVQNGELAVDAIVKMLASAPVPRQIMVPGNVVTRDSLLTPTPPATQAQ
jgi:ribose transport system substrate-binding protein